MSITVQGNTGITGNTAPQGARPAGSLMEGTRVALGNAPTTTSRLANASTSARDFGRDHAGLRSA